MVLTNARAISQEKIAGNKMIRRLSRKHLAKAVNSAFKVGGLKRARWVPSSRITSLGSMMKNAESSNELH
jgi:hypothetical protein